MLLLDGRTLPQQALPIGSEGESDDEGDDKSDDGYLPFFDHSGTLDKRQRFLVRWKGTNASMDSWLPGDRITGAALVSYEEFLQAHAKTISDGKRASLLFKSRIDKYH